MIGYLKGKILHTASDSILLLVGAVGYEVMLNSLLLEKLSEKGGGPEEETALFIYYHQTERTPKPVLIGFDTLEEKAFFQTFITVDAIGPMKAVKALNKPVGEIARAIENKDIQFLCGLNGIGKRSAQKIVATLQGKVAQFALQSVVSGADSTPTAVSETEPPPVSPELSSVVEDVLVEQLGHSQSSARRMIREAMGRKPDIDTPEALFDEVFREKG